MKNENLLSDYIEHILENMDVKDLVAYVADDLEYRLGDYTEKDLINEIAVFAPHLLDEETK